MRPVRYLTREDILAYHAAEFRRRGLSAPPIISDEKLEAALERPKASAFGSDAYPAVAEKAAALLQSLVVGHPFMDGNKRIGLGACLLFLELNGVGRRVDPDAMADLVLDIATGRLKEVEAIAERLRILYAPDLDER